MLDVESKYRNISNIVIYGTLPNQYSISYNITNFSYIRLSQSTIRKILYEMFGDEFDCNAWKVPCSVRVTMTFLHRCSVF